MTNTKIFIWLLFFFSWSVSEILFQQQTKSFTAELQAKPEYHKFLIGKGGGNIRKVRDSTGARIIFPTADDKDQELITVIGTEEAVQEAQKELEELIKSLVSLSSDTSRPQRNGFVSYTMPKSVYCQQDNVIEDTMTVDPKHHRYFVSRRGQVLRDLADEYGGVMVSFPRTGSQSEKVTIKGAKECVEAAKKRMQEIVEDLVSRKQTCPFYFFPVPLLFFELSSLQQFFRMLKWPSSVWFLRSSTVQSWVPKAHGSNKSPETTMYKLSSQSVKTLKVLNQDSRENRNILLSLCVCICLKY